jgi:hypothetical protein
MKKYMYMFLLMLLLTSCVRPAPAPDPVSFSTYTLSSSSGTSTAIVVKASNTPLGSGGPTPFIITPTDENPITPTSEFTDTPSATDTPSPTDTPTEPPTPAEPGFDPVARWNSPRFIDTFDSDDNWVAKNGELPDTGNIKLEIIDNTLSVTGKHQDFDTWWFSSSTLGDMYVEMTINTGDCKEDDAYGIILRGAPSGEPAHGYIAGFTCDGKYFVRRLDTTDPYIVASLFTPANNDYIIRGSGKTSVLGFLAVKNEFTLYSNGYEVAYFTDETYDIGRYGVFIKAGPTENYSYTVSRIRVWDLRYK